jgi:hypothetical protein
VPTNPTYLKATAPDACCFRDRRPSISGPTRYVLSMIGHGCVAMRPPPPPHCRGRTTGSTTRGSVLYSGRAQRRRNFLRHSTTAPRASAANPDADADADANPLPRPESFPSGGGGCRDKDGRL